MNEIEQNSVIPDKIKLSLYAFMQLGFFRE